MENNCSSCIFFRKCAESGIVETMDTGATVCSSFEDFDFFVEINEWGKSGYEWVEMAHSRYTETAWDTEPTDWEIYEKEQNRLLEIDLKSDRKKKRNSVEN